MMEIKTKLKSFIGFLLLLIVLTPSAYGLSTSFSTDRAGTTVDFKALDKDNVYSSITLSQSGVLNTITGTAGLTESHWVANKGGAYAEVGVDIKGATKPYTYSYALDPGEGGGKTTSYVEASEDLDVPYATQINAYARARNGAGYVSLMGTEVTDGSLQGYHNSAWASADKVDTSQGFTGASGIVTTDSGSFTWGKKNIPNGRAEGQWKDILPETGISTTVTGEVTGYAASATKTATSSVTQQDGHISGTFTSTAATDKGTIIKTTPEYGNEYDLHMLAKKGNNPIGTLGLYVNPGWTIQGAVDAAEIGDKINVNPGTYYENVKVYKSVDIIGKSPLSTIVDGSTATDSIGSVFSIGMDKSGNYVPGVVSTLSGMTIQGGTGTPTDVWPGGGPYSYAKSGGGVWNAGELTLQGCKISDNHLAWNPWPNVLQSYGGGVYNDRRGIATINDCTLSGNIAYQGVAIENLGALTVSHSTISGNYGGGGVGIYNEGKDEWGTKADMLDTTITGNTAYFWGGGIENFAPMTLTNCLVSGNNQNGYIYWPPVGDGPVGGYIGLKAKLVLKGTTQIVGNTPWNHYFEDYPSEDPNTPLNAPLG